MFRLPWRRKERICLITAHDSRFEALARLSGPRMTAICEAQDYELRSIKVDDCSRKGGWLKIGPIRQALEEQFDWLLWVDADALFLRADEDIRAEIRDDVDIQMALHEPQPKSRHEELSAHFNTGVMLIRRCDWARDFFARVWDKGQIAHRWHDQATILLLLGYNDIVEQGPRRLHADDHKRVGTLRVAWNAIPGVASCHDPIVHHYAGVRFDTRLRLMEMDAASIPFRQGMRRSKRARYAELFHRLRHHAESVDDIEDAILSLDASIGRQLRGDRLDRAAATADIAIGKSPIEGGSS